MAEFDIIKFRNFLVEEQDKHVYAYTQLLTNEGTVRRDDVIIAARESAAALVMAELIKAIDKARV